MKTVGMWKAISVVVILFMTAVAHAGTYKYTGDTTRGKNANVEYWTDGTNHPDYPPTDPNSLGTEDIYIVKENKELPATTAGGELRYYGNLVIGEVDGTVGKIRSEAQQGREMRFDNVTFANGNYFDIGASGFDRFGTDCCGYLAGSITVTAPESAPFTFTYNNGTAADAPRKVYYDAVFHVADGCAYKFNDTTHYAMLIWGGSLAEYLGTLDLSCSDKISVVFQDTIGTTNFKELKFCGGSVHSNNCVTAPLMAKTLTIGDGATFDLAASTVGEAVKYASLKCETAAIAGRVNLNLQEFADLPNVMHDNTIEIVLFEATGGGLIDGMFNVDLGANATKAAFRGCAVNGDGTKLVATFVFPADLAYYASGRISRTELNDTSKWMNLEGVNPAYGLLDEGSSGETFVLPSDVLISGFSGGSVFYPSLVVGAFGGTSKAQLYYEVQSGGHTFSNLVFRNADLYFDGGAYADRRPFIAGKIVVETPVSSPLSIHAEQGSGNGGSDEICRREFRASISGASTAGIAWTDESHFAEFYFSGDMSKYEGSLDFSLNNNALLVFGLEVGVLDFNDAKFASNQKVVLEGKASGLNYQMPCLRAKAFTLGGDLNITLDLSEKIPATVERIPVLQTSGAIDANLVKVQAQGAGAKRFKGVVTEVANGVTTVYAQVPPPGLCLVVR